MLYSATVRGVDFDTCKQLLEDSGLIQDMPLEKLVKDTILAIVCIIW